MRRTSLQTPEARVPFERAAVTTSPVTSSTWKLDLLIIMVSVFTSSKCLLHRRSGDGATSHQQLSSVVASWSRMAYLWLQLSTARFF